MKRVLFVYNPVSGTGRIRKNMFEVVDFYNSRDCLVTLCPIRKLEAYEAFWSGEADTYDLVVCCGGDGTLNILFSLMKRKGLRKEIAYVPAGSTNDFAYSLGLKGDFADALNRTLTGSLRHFDAGQFGDKYFLYVAAFGIFTKASYNTPQKNKNALGHTAYVLEGIRELSELKSYHMRVETDNQVIEDDFILGLITNSLSIGGFRNLLPADTALDDGEFEIMLIRMPKNLMELQAIIAALASVHPGDDKYVYCCKTKTVRVCASEPVEWTVDGEFGGSTAEANVRVLRGELEMRV